MSNADRSRVPSWRRPAWRRLLIGLALFIFVNVDPERFFDPVVIGLCSYWLFLMWRHGKRKQKLLEEQASGAVTWWSPDPS